MTTREKAIFATISVRIFIEKRENLDFESLRSGINE